MQKKKQILYILAIVLLSFNLRSAITGVGSVVQLIQEDLGLSGSIAGFLTTIPLFAFALMSSFCRPLSQKLGLGRFILLALLVIAAGVLCRSFGGTVGMLLGTIAIGLGIAVGNVLLPVVVKAIYPNKVGVMTGVYTTGMSLSAAAAAALTVPMANALGWRGSLAMFSIPAILAAVIWWFLRSYKAEGNQSGNSQKMLRSKTAWYCALFMGSQSILFYSVSAWLPSILASRGISATTAGIYASVYQLSAIPMNFLAPMLAEKFKDQRTLARYINIFYLLGLVLLCISQAPWLLLIATVLCGCGTAATFSLCMALIPLRTSNAEDAASLSGMVQTFGYFIAAFGPVFFGKLFDLSGAWVVPILAMMAILLVNGYFGQKAGKEEMI